MLTMTVNQTFISPKKLCFHKDQNLNKNHETTQLIRMSTKTKRPPEYLKYYHCNLNIFNTSSRVKYSILSYNKLSSSYKSFVMPISSHVEPNTYSEVVKYDCWRKAIQCEISIHSITYLRLPPIYEKLPVTDRLARHTSMSFLKIELGS